VLQDHRSLRAAPRVVFSPFTQRQLPGLLCDVAEAAFTVANPARKPGLRAALRRAMRARGVSRRAALKEGLRTWRVFR